MQAKAEQAWEAEKLAKRQARSPEVAVQSALSALHNRKAALARSQANVIELEAAAKAAVEAAEEAKQKTEKLQGEIDKLQTEPDVEVARLVNPSDPVTHLWNNVREAFQALSGNPEAQPLIAQLETAFTGLSSLLAAATPTPVATDVRDDTDMQPDKEKATSNEAMARALERSFACPRRNTRPKRQRWWSTSSKRGMFGHLKAPHQHCLSVLAACKRPQAWGQASNPLHQFWLEKDVQFARLIRKHPGHLPLPTSLRGNLDS